MLGLVVLTPNRMIARLHQPLDVCRRNAGGSGLDLAGVLAAEHSREHLPSEVPAREQDHDGDGGDRDP